MDLLVNFMIDFGLFAVLLVIITAFMGIVSTKVAETIGRKHKDKDFNMNQKTKQGWKSVGGNN